MKKNLTKIVVALVLSLCMISSMALSGFALTNEYIDITVSGNVRSGVSYHTEVDGYSKANMTHNTSTDVVTVDAATGSNTVGSTCWLTVQVRLWSAGTTTFYDSGMNSTRTFNQTVNFDQSNQGFFTISHEVVKNNRQVWEAETQYIWSGYLDVGMYNPSM